MACSALRSSRYKLKTTFDADTTVHTTFMRSKNGEMEIQTRWRREKDIGVGGFGVVWLEVEEDGQLRAVKRLPQGAKTNWSRELEILAQLREHQALFVKFLGWYESEDKDFAFFAMEYIEHGDLREYLNILRSEVMPQAKDITTQILKGLVILHKHNICHRDIKPKNILIASTSPIRVKIADFGMSKHLENTSLRTNCGTSGYLAPELQGFTSARKLTGSYTNLVDIWSLGVLTHEILTLDMPFLSYAPSSDSGLEQYSGLVQISGREPEPMIDMYLFADYCRGRQSFPRSTLQKFRVSDEGIDFVMKLLAANPGHRISAEEALQSPWLLNNTPEPYISALPPRIPHKHERKMDTRNGRSPYYMAGLSTPPTSPSAFQDPSWPESRSPFRYMAGLSTPPTSPGIFQDTSRPELGGLPHYMAGLSTPPTSPGPFQGVSRSEPRGPPHYIAGLNTPPISPGAFQDFSRLELRNPSRYMAGPSTPPAFPSAFQGVSRPESRSSMMPMSRSSTSSISRRSSSMESISRVSMRSTSSSIICSYALNKLLSEEGQEQAKESPELGSRRRGSLLPSPFGKPLRRTKSTIVSTRPSTSYPQVRLEELTPPETPKQKRRDDNKLRKLPRRASWAFGKKKSFENLNPTDIATVYNSSSMRLIESENHQATNSAATAIEGHQQRLADETIPTQHPRPVFRSMVKSIMAWGRKKKN